MCNQILTCEVPNAIPAPTRSRARKDGFTLIEIMAVVIIMGMLIGVVGTNIFSKVDQARITATRAKISTVESALEYYRMDNSKYPTNLDGLRTAPSDAKNFPRGGYVKNGSALLDAWDQPLQYQNPGTNNQYGVDITSPGPDGVPGNADDVSNWSDSSAS